MPQWAPGGPSAGLFDKQNPNILKS